MRNIAIPTVSSVLAGLILWGLKNLGGLNVGVEAYVIVALMGFLAILILMSINTKFKAIDFRVKDLLDAQVSLFPILISMAEKKKEIVQELLKLNAKILSGSLEREHRLMNPLTVDELTRLESYYERLKRGEWLSADEAKDFEQLASKFKEDTNKGSKMDVGAVILAEIAGLVLGIVLASGDKDKKKQ